MTGLSLVQDWLMVDEFMIGETRSWCWYFARVDHDQLTRCIDVQIGVYSNVAPQHVVPYSKVWLLSDSFWSSLVKTAAVGRFLTNHQE